VGYQGSDRDITERKQIEEALRKQHSALEGILGSTNASIFSLDKDYKYTMFNSRHAAIMEAFYGATVEMGRSILKYMTVKVDRAKAKQNIDRALKGESHVDSAYSGEEARSRRYIEVSHNPIRSQDGSVTGVAVLSHDITERKKAEDNLVASEKRFRSIWDNSADGMRLTNSEGRIIEVNEAYCRMVNITRDNLIGQFFSVVYKRGGMDDDLNLYVERFRSGKVGPQVSTTATLWDGRPIDLEISSSFIGLTGHDKMLLSIFRDITERKRTEEELKKSHEKFRELFDNAPVGYHELDATGTITNVNLTELQMLGFTLEEMVGRPVWEFVGGGELSRKRVLDKLAGVVPPNNNAERMYRRKDGTTIPVLIDESLLRNQRGEVSGIRTVIQDITEKKRAEGALRQLEEKYRSLFEESKDVIYISTPKGKLLDINPAGVDLLGYNSKEEMLQIEIAHDLFVDPRQREVLQQLMEDKGFIRNYEEVLRRKDGKKINVLDTATAVRDAKGRTILFRGIMRDVTKEKQLEEELTQIQKLESIGTLASGIAHDFNNILGIILGYSSLMERTGGDPQSLSQSAQAINKAVQRGANLVSQILTFARKTDVLVGPVDLNVMVKELFKMLKETFPKKIELSLQLSKDIQFINADATQVHQVLLNLSVNSRDAMSSGGTLTFKTEVVKGSNLRNIFSNTSDGDYVHLNVSDTGIGMDEKTRSQIFDPFFTTKEKGKGTGLGLSVVYGVIKNHNGFVNVESEPGKGSTFNLYFPISAESLRATGKEAEDREEVRGGTETILVVEDEEALLTMLKVILEVKGYRVIAAVDGLEALELFRKHKDEIALVMTDVGLPKISGDQLFFELKKVNPSVRVVLMSGYIDARLKSEIFRAGVHDFVQKPYEPNEVLKKVRESIDRK
jgi:PAS domain S-box-containing protein